MNTRKTITIVTLSFVIVGIGFFLNNLQIMPAQDRTIPTLGSLEALGLSAPHCSMNIQQVQTSIGNNYKIPHSLPSGFSIQVGWIDNNTLVLYFAKGSVCGTTTDQTILHTMIKYVADKSTGSKISDGQKYVEDLKSNSKKGYLMSLLNINGNPAIGWETGIRYSITMWDNGTIISKQPIPYPAEIRIVNTADNTLYIIKGYHSLDELKEIAGSIQ